MNVTLTSASESDLAVIRHLAREIWPRVFSEMISAAQIAYMLDWLYNPEKLAADIEKGMRYDVLRADGVPIGYTGYGFTGEREGVKLDKLYVAPEQQGRGHGSRMIRHIVAWAEEQEAPSVWLRVNKNNPRAIALYRREGFDIAEPLVEDIGGGFVMDDYVMIRKV